MAVSYRMRAFAAWSAGLQNLDAIVVEIDGETHAIPIDRHSYGSSDAAATDIEYLAEYILGRNINIYKVARDWRQGRRAELLAKHCGIKKRGTLHRYFK